MASEHPHKRYEKKHEIEIKQAMEDELQKRIEKQEAYRKQNPKKDSVQKLSASTVTFVDTRSNQKAVPAWKKWETQYQLALNLNKVIDEKELTLDKISKDTGIKKSSMSCYASGTAEAGADAVKKLAKYFSVSSDYLLGLTGTMTVIPEKKKACEYTGLSDEAVDVLRKGFKDQNRPLYSQIMSHLISEGIFDNLVKQLENSLIQQEQYYVLFGESEQQQNVLETQEYLFNKQLSGLYSNVMDELGKELSSQIEHIANQRFFDLIDGAMDTKVKMEQIIEEALSDPQILAEYNKRGFADNL